jgi:hypothetical protein
MDSGQKNADKQRVDAWKAATKILAELRAKELPLTDTTKGLQSLLPAFAASIRETKLSSTSGLFEQQRIFSRSAR